MLPIIFGWLPVYTMESKKTVVKKVFPCPSCCYEALQACAINRHKCSRKTPEYLWQCGLCQLRFFNQIRFKHHLNYGHNEAIKKVVMFCCYLCWRPYKIIQASFQDRVLYEQHMLHHHKIVVKQPSLLYFFEPKCANAQEYNSGNFGYADSARSYQEYESEKYTVSQDVHMSDQSSALLPAESYSQGISTGYNIEDIRPEDLPLILRFSPNIIMGPNHIAVPTDESRGQNTFQFMCMLCQYDGRVSNFNDRDSFRNHMKKEHNIVVPVPKKLCMP